MGSRKRKGKKERNIRVPQRESLKPLAQRHVKELSPSTQVAPFWQGLEAQLLMTKTTRGFQIFNIKKKKLKKN